MESKETEQDMRRKQQFNHCIESHDCMSVIDCIAHPNVVPT